jgi:hypothetical protein
MSIKQAWALNKLLPGTFRMECSENDHQFDMLKDLHPNKAKLKKLEEPRRGFPQSKN